jgi:UDP-N-acetylglucosamine--N-acetylmuramyl-(pentapeptide) pyrophosphoryl-undecaprenol N-acetylglucosamine transferase
MMAPGRGSRTGNDAGPGDPPPVRVLVTGGGTGGHVYPGLAVAGALAALVPGVDIRFAGTSRGIEATLIPGSGHRLYTVPASGFRGMGPAARLRFLGNFLRGFLRSLIILVGWRPQVVLGTGGYVSAPVMAAARVLRIPCALQEQNAIPGSTNRLVGRWARRIYLGFAGAGRYFRTGVCVTTGNPVRAEFLDDLARRPSAAGSGDRKQVLVFGGSGGAASLNRAVTEAADSWRNRSGVRFLVQTGKREWGQVAAAYEGSEAVEVVPYIDDMARALLGSDLVVCRAGAMTLAELQATGRPAVLVPFPHATDDHQSRNAEDCAAAGAARVLPDDRCDGSTLVGMVDELLNDAGELAKMSAAARSLAHPEAAVNIAADLLDLAGHPAGRRLDPGREDRASVS